MIRSPKFRPTPVVIIGAGPAGLTIGNLLRAAAVDCVIVETSTRAEIERRPRAGVLEEGCVRGLDEHGLAANLLARAQRQTECEFRFRGERHRLDFEALTGHRHWVYPQQLLVADLVREYADVRGGEIEFGVRDVELHDLDTNRPLVSYTDAATGQRRQRRCDFIAGCDGAHGVTRAALPDDHRIVRHDYGIGWLALLAEAPPSNDCATFGLHPDGFAGHMSRGPDTSRYYLQCRPGDGATAWSADQVWSRLRRRLTAAEADPITEGRLIEQRLLALHSYVVEPMSFGRLHLAGDAAHLIPPIAPKGMNLALHDAFLLAEALINVLRHGDGGKLDRYSATGLERVRREQAFSHSFAELLHGAASDDPYVVGVTDARLRRLFTSAGAATAFAEQFLGAGSRGTGEGPGW